MERKMNSIFHRTSIRKYVNQPVEEEKVELLLRAAMAAPSAGNQQPWAFYVVTNPEVLAQLAACSPYAGCVKEAPLAIVTCYKNEGVRFPEYVEIDLSACTENILLEADALGLGTVWLGMAPLKERMQAVKEVLHMPETLEAFAVIPCGYPKTVNAQRDRYDTSRIYRIE